MYISHTLHHMSVLVYRSLTHPTTFHGSLHEVCALGGCAAPLIGHWEGLRKVMISMNLFIDYH